MRASFSLLRPSTKRIRYFLLIPLMLWCGPWLYAQEHYLGLKGGLSIPSISGGNNEVSRGYKSRLAPNFGAYLEWGVTDKFSLQPEVNFAGQGGKRNGLQPITMPPAGLPALPAGVYYYADFKNTALLNYLEVPVLAKYTWGAKKKYYVNAGPYAGYLLSAKTETSGTSSIYLDKNRTPLLLPPLNQPLPPVSFDATTDVKSDINRFNLGITGGGGLRLPAGRNYVFVDARVAYGLTNIQKDTALNGKSHTGNLVVSVGYAFRLK